jgi:hypothetical protein
MIADGPGGDDGEGGVPWSATATAGGMGAFTGIDVAGQGHRASAMARTRTDLRDPLSGRFPAPARRIDPTTRTTGARRIVRKLTQAATNLRGLEALAAAAGLAPVLRQSGRTRPLRCATGGDGPLRRVFCRAAFTSQGRPDSPTFHDRKRAEGKRHHPAVIASARPRETVRGAIRRNREPVRENVKPAL